MQIIPNRKIFYIISGALTVVSLAVLFLWGLKPGIDFTGGSLLEAEFIKERPAAEAVNEIFHNAGIEYVVAQKIGELGYVFRFRDISEAEHGVLTAKLSGNSLNSSEVFIEKRFTTIGPAIGKELKVSSYKAVALVLVFILLYIALVFRKVSAPVSSWKYGFIAIITLIHDVSIPMGLFAYLGYFYGKEVDMLFISGVLTILGFSVHDTIVVFDRVREKLLRERLNVPFEHLVESAVQETIVRSVTTSLTAIIALLAVFIFGGEVTRDLALLLIVGIAVGVYSSIFIGSSLLVSLEKIQKRT